MSARVLMFQGTGSDVGKSVLVAALCRILSRRGIKVLPFNPQNMSNNAAVTQDGGEIGRAQWLQALACGTAPTVHMNPVLLKPESEKGAQVIVHGKVRGRAEAQYYRTHKADLLAAVMGSFEELKAQADIVLVEGAGSPAEVNLRAGDIANMGFALPTHTPVVLIGDINKGGVIASLVGTHAVLPPEERALIKGTIINLFRGDMSLFDEGLKVIENRTGWRNFGIMPFVRALKELPAEDAVPLESFQEQVRKPRKVAVPLLPHISNFDDFDPLRDEPDCTLVFCPPGTALPQDADLIILPGSKATLSDLRALKREGWHHDIIAHIRAGKPVFGICGGYQMLGSLVCDPEGFEGVSGEEEGLCLLNVETVMTADKTVRQTQGYCPAYECVVEGYEIHRGETTVLPGSSAYAYVGDRVLGAASNSLPVSGIYLHGLFTGGAFRQAFLRNILSLETQASHHRQRIEHLLDTAADEMENYLDVDALLAVAR